MAETIGARERGRITPDEGAVLAAETARNADFGKPVLIYPNLYLVRVPLPHNPLRALNSYFILDDVGFNHPDCEQALDDALAALGRSWDKVQVVLTHSHPDHTGNLDRIWREGMPVLANLHSFQEVKNLMEIEDNVYGPLLLQAATLEQQRDLTFDEKGPRLHVSAELLPLSTYPVMTYLADGDCLKVGEFEFEVIETPGHDPWHICLYEAAHKILLSGDHVLERITPSVSSWFPAYNALAEFLESLEKVGGYDVDLVLPAHGKPFTGMRERVDFLIEHHHKRLEEIYAQYGRYLNKVDSFEFPGLTGMEKMASIMQKLRDEPLTELAGHKVVKVTDYKKPEETGLPAANVLIYTLDNGATVVVRPSGTEPKIKTYFTTLGKDLAEAQAQKDALAAAIEPILA